MSKLEIYEEVWSSVRQKLNKTKDSKFVKNENLLWWRSPQKNYQSPFTLRVVNESGKVCGQCNWSEKCYGCLIDQHHYWRYIAVDWELDILGG